MGFYATDRKLMLELEKEKPGKEKSEKENMTLEEFERVLKEEHIPREWVSLNQDYKAPVTLSGDTLRYGKYGNTRFTCGIHYEHILEILREYKEEQDLIKSDRIAQITDIMIDSSEQIREYGDVFVVRRVSFNSDHDTELLEQGFEYKGYDQYMAYYNYEKVCGDEIFTGVEIGLKVKTQYFERKQYGFRDTVMCSCVTFPLPIKLKDKIIKYIKDNKTKVISNEDYLFQEIINEYGFENIIEEESKRIKFFDEVYKNILGYELERQKFLKQYSEEKLLEVYRKINMYNIFTEISTLSSRPTCIQDFRLHEAKKILDELMAEQLKEIGTISKAPIKEQKSAKEQTATEEQIPTKPEMSKEASDYPRLHKIHMELLRTDDMILEAEKECSDIEKKLDNLKGISKFIMVNRLQNQLNLKRENIDKLKGKLSDILKGNGFQSMEFFNKTYDKSRNDYMDYQKQIAKGEE